jgi:hypothetical protein
VFLPCLRAFVLGVDFKIAAEYFEKNLRLSFTPLVAVSGPS